MSQTFFPSNQPSEALHLGRSHTFPYCVPRSNGSSCTSFKSPVSIIYSLKISHLCDVHMLICLALE
uniref:Putative ovule protein n=1 Tax=Solanum chacoense TaxID=4108 RepID=A0A0V0GRM9_SOLCH